MGRLINRVKVHIPDRIWQIMRMIFNPKRPKRKLRVEIHIVDHCNLNCRGCDNFSCIAAPFFLDVEDYKRDLSRLKEVFGEKVEWITLIGGEPLLNERIIEYCDIARNLFPDALIRIISNGTLLLSKNGDFWDGLKKNDVLLYVTKYPVNFNYDEAKKLAERKGVHFEYAFESGDTLKTMYKTPLDIEGKQNPWISYHLCGRGNKCITLRNGKLFTCEIIPNFFSFNNFFGTNIQVTPADYIDIYENDDPRRIMRKLASCTSACRYCDNIHYHSGIGWGVTERKITEWI